MTRFAAKLLFVLFTALAFAFGCLLFHPDWQ